MNARDPALTSRHLRHRLATHLAVPGTVEVEAVLLLSDIVSFTAHVEAISGSGRSGVEQFNESMNRYMDTMISLIDASGGDVVNIAGDALLSMWPVGSSRTVHDAAVAAASAALAAQRAVHGHALPLGRTLETRIGIATGTVALVAAGGHGGRAGPWELIPQGDVVGRVEDAERLAPPGGVAVDDATATLLAGSATLNPLGGGLHVLGEVDAIAPAPPEPRVDDLDRALRSMEFRRLSVGMCRFSDDAFADPEQAHRLLATFQAIVTEREGTTWLNSDNKGVRLVATFGAPPHAHEDDPARAVDAMRSVLAAVEPMGVKAAAGVSTGRALYGTVGNDIRRAETMAGELINVAARLCSTAQGTVLCDHETAEGAQARYAFTVLSAIRVKGKSQAVPVFEPVAAVLEPRRRSVVMRGRADELAVLSGVATDRQGSTDAVIVGEAGLGKSTLVEAAVAMALRAEREVLTVRTDAIDRTTPFLAWRPLVAEVLGLGTTRVPTRTAVAERLRELLPTELVQHVALVANLLAPNASEPPLPTDETDPNTILPLAVAELVMRGRERPMIVFEDAHWSDTGSLFVLDALARRLVPPTIVVSTRPEGLARLSALTGRATTATLTLNPIDDAAVVEIMADQLGTENLPAILVQFVHQRVAGNPYFCEQLVKSLVETSLVVSGHGAVAVGDLDEAEIPSTVEGVIVSRFDRIGSDAQQALKAAAVVGRRHEVATVQACLPMLEVATILDALGDDGLVRRVDADSFEFQHVIARDVVYDLMTDQQRRQLHRIVADHLERQGNQVAATIGRHWRAAGDFEKAASYLEQAAHDALASGSFSGTVALLDEAAEARASGSLEPDTLHRARLAVARARASYYLGQYADSRRELESVVALIGEALPADHEAHLAEHARLEDLVGQVIAADEVGEAESILFDTYRNIVKVLYLLGAPSDLLVTVSLRGLYYARLMGKPLEAASIQALVAGSYATVGDAEHFDRHSHEAIAVAEGPDGASVKNHVWRMLAVGYAGFGRWAASLDASDRALAAMDPEGQNRDSGIWQTRAAVHLCAGQFTAAEHAWRMTHSIAVRDGNQRLLRWSRLDEVQTLVGRERIDEAADALQAMMVELGPPTDPLGTIEQHYTLAIVRSAQRRHREAVMEARGVVRMVEAVPPSGFHWVEFCSGAAEAMIAALHDRKADDIDRDQLSAEIAHVLDLLSGFAGTFPHVAPRVPLGRALLEAGLGRPEDAAEQLRLARAIALAGDFEYDAARCAVLHHTLGLPGDRPELAPARQTMADLGAWRWVTRADSVRSVG